MKISSLIFLLLMLAACQKDQETETSTAIFSKGKEVSNNNFTGKVWVEMLLNPDSTFNTNIGNVTFEPSARSNWHYHPGGQILLVTEGEGYYQEDGQAIQVIKKGDVVRCSPDVVHWHGASPNKSMTHIAIGTNQNKGIVVWLKPVTDEEYLK